MLILARRVNEQIVINGDITVTVVDIGRGRVQVGISAPLDMSIHREEIYRRIQNERQLHANAPAGDARQFITLELDTAAV